MITIILIIFAFFFLYTGIHSLMSPRGFAKMINLEPIERSGEIEIRAQYGGFFLAASLSQFAALTGYLAISTALMISLVIFGGLIFGRLVSLIFKGSQSPITSMIRNLYLIDAMGTVGAITGLLLLP